MFLYLNASRHAPGPSALLSENRQFRRFSESKAEGPGSCRGDSLACMHHFSCHYRFACSMPCRARAHVECAQGQEPSRAEQGISPGNRSDSCMARTHRRTHACAHACTHPTHTRAHARTHARTHAQHTHTQTPPPPMRACTTDVYTPASMSRSHAPTMRARACVLRVSVLCMCVLARARARAQVCLYSA